MFQRVIKEKPVRPYWTGCILLSTAVSASAATLGRHSGAAIIGRPLDVSVQVLLAPGEDLANQCLSADVFFGDLQQPPGVVRTTPLRRSSDGEPVVRIQTTLAVNEPVVTLYVKAGCGAPFARRYVLLADLINEPAVAAAAPQAAAVAGSPSAPAPAAAPASAPAATRDAASPATPAAPRATASAARPPRPAAAPAPRSAAPRAERAARAPAPSGSRLQLVPVDIDPGVERDPSLKLSSQMLSEPTTSESARAEAAALWKALNAPPEEVLKNARRVAELEAQAAALTKQQQEAQRREENLAIRLAESEASRYRNPVIYGLVALLLAALGALGWMWRRQRAAEVQRQWWTPEPAAEPEAPATASPTPPQPEVKFGRRSGDSGMVPLDPTPAIDEDSRPADLVAETGAAPLPPLPSLERRGFAMSMTGTSRSVATEELFDIQQQADFFVSLGEDEQAIEVLRNHLSESQEPSAMAYLDLFKLYHRLGRRDDYDRLREEFNLVFNAGAPEFDRYADQGRGLEAYEAAFARIQSLWPQPRVLDLIERSIFRDTVDGNTEVFDLEAYRELLMLHAIAKDIIQGEQPPRRPLSDFQNTAMQPLKAGKKGTAPEAAAIAAAMVSPGIAESVRVTRPMDISDVPVASPNLGLDLNLDEIEDASAGRESQLTDVVAFEALLPEIDHPIEPTAQRADSQRGNLIDFEIVDMDDPAARGNGPADADDTRPPRDDNA